MLVNVNQQPSADNRLGFGGFSDKYPDTDYQQNGTLTRNAYDEIGFPNVFKKHAKASIYKKLETQPDISEIFQTDIPLNPSSEDRETLFRNWFKFFDKVFFFEGLGKGEISINLMFDNHPFLPDNGAFVLPKIIYVNITKVFDENDHAIWSGDWSAWAINLLLHEMLHAFIYFYGTQSDFPAGQGGIGKEGHGRPFVSFLVHLNDALKSAVYEKAPRKFKVEGFIPAVVIDSMCLEDWRPKLTDMNEALGWGLSMDIFKKLTGEWSKIPEEGSPLPAELFNLHNNLAMYGTLERATDPELASEHTLSSSNQIRSAFF